MPMIVIDTNYSKKKLITLGDILLLHCCRVEYLFRRQADRIPRPNTLGCIVHFHHNCTTICRRKTLGKRRCLVHLKEKHVCTYARCCAPTIIAWKQKSNGLQLIISGMQQVSLSRLLRTYVGNESMGWIRVVEEVKPIKKTRSCDVIL